LFWRTLDRPQACIYAVKAKSLSHHDLRLQLHIMGQG
jgi:hypothetical protein